MVRPQRRQVVLVRMLSTVRMSSPSLVISVWRTRTSGMSSGIEMSGCLGIGGAPSVASVSRALFCTIPTRGATPTSRGTHGKSWRTKNAIDHDFIRYGSHVHDLRVSQRYSTKEKQRRRLGSESEAGSTGGQA